MVPRKAFSGRPIGYFFWIAGIVVALLSAAGIALLEPDLGLTRALAYQGSGFLLIGVCLYWLYLRVEDRTGSMVDELKELDALKAEFLSTVSHELRTPLTSIGGYVKLLGSGDCGPVTDSQREFLGIIDTNVDRLSNLINDLLDVERMDAGKVELQREPQDLASILKECVTTFGVLARQKGLELSFFFPPGNLTVVGDHDRLVQVFMNLVSNAIKYTSQGSVHVEVEKNDYAVVIRIRDTGVGLSDEDREKLFQKFYRARSSVAHAERGTGLGLVIARKIVEAHNGTITVESELSKGTTFSVTLPLSKAAQTENATTDAKRALAQQFRDVWIIDSDRTSVDAMSEMLREIGSGLAAFKLRHRHFASLRDVPEVINPDEAPDVLVLDPSDDEGGLQMIPVLRKKLHQSVPILVVSATVDARAVFAEGAAALVSKPVLKQAFVSAIRALLLRKNWKVLVADSNTDSRILIKRAMEQSGLNVDDVELGNHVISKLDQESYDLLLLDLKLSDIPGGDLLQLIRGIPRYEKLPVFVMSVEDPSPTEIAKWGSPQYVAKYRGLNLIVDSVWHHLEALK